jgi:hypothetical protein
MTMQELVDYAYQLPADGYIDGKTLTGKIITVNSAFDSSYNNITVTIVVEGREDKPIECYRLKGNGVDAIAVGDTITVSGSLVNFRGEKIEFNTGCQLVSYVKEQNGGELDPSDINYVYGSYGTSELSLDVIFHFHGLENCNYLTRLHDITDIYFHSYDYAWER